MIVCRHTAASGHRGVRAQEPRDVAGGGYQSAYHPCNALGTKAASAMLQVHALLYKQRTHDHLQDVLHNMMGCEPLDAKLQVLWKHAHAGHLTCSASA